jgi:hypothetical protein
MQPNGGMELEKELWVGLCVGGPIDGQEGYSRFPKGFLLCDRPSDRLWIYDWSEADQKFLVRDAGGVDLIESPEAPDNRWRAALEGSYDVVALPGDNA